MRGLALTSVAMVAFAGNSLLCRAALQHTHIDAASFTAIRLVSGAAVLWLLVRATSNRRSGAGSWISACALFAYAAGFSFAYVSLPAATGALLLFGAVQATMIGAALWRGERLRVSQSVGLALACAGLIGLLLPGISAPPIHGATLMLIAGVAWGFYSLRGKGAADPLKVTAGNFLRAAPLGVGLGLVASKGVPLNCTGAWYAIASGALASGAGYAIWYAALPAMRSTSAAAVQLSVPVIAALGGILFLGEAVTMRLILTSAAILGGIALVVLEKPLAP